MFNVVILTEADYVRGYGHLGRCCALYDALSELGAEPTLLVRGQASARIVEQRSYRDLEWASPNAATEVLADADAAVVDSYEADAQTYSAIAHSVLATAYMDDTARLAYPRGVVVNGSPEASPQRYQGDSDVELLLGLAYQPLRRAFWDLPARSAPRASLSRVLVVFGGGDSRDLLDSVLPVLAAAHPDVDFDVVDSPRSAEEMREAMLAADAAVTAAGQTLYELARVGTPAVSVSVADNQLAQARAWSNAGASLFVGSSTDLGIADALARGLSLLADPDVRARMSAVGPGLVDGRGALRVAKALLWRVLDRRTHLLPATARDAEEILALSNDPEVRRSSLSTKPISREEHGSWLSNRLAHPESAVTLLAWDGRFLAAQVRFDVTDLAAVVSISIAGPYRGLGWSPLLLERAVRHLGQAMPEVRTLVAKVRPENIASRNLFERAGFTRTDAESDGSGHLLGGAVEYRRAAVPE